MGTELRPWAAREGLAAACAAVLILGAGCRPARPTAPTAPPQPPPAAPPRAAGAAASPGGPARLDAAALLYPRHTGDWWELREKVGSETHTVRLAVEPATAPTTETAFDVATTRDGARVQTERYTVTDEGVFRVAAGQEAAARIVPPMPVLRLPFSAGARWTWRGALVDAVGSLPAEATFHLTGPEKVEVPAGSFQAYRLDQEFTLQSPEGPQTVANRQWLVPKVGLVKQTTDDGKAPATAELMKFRVAE
ncbi:MAG: hypothetical protein IT208_08600 [Chthonomonadales bacterium]|nr:hypothetical protein [Chthonomonadales bacterium]